MGQRSNRSKKRRQQQPAADAATPNQYSKYLPEWMRANGGVAPRPRVRRARQQRPAGGYTPGKFAIDADPLA